ncbi:hypothetical protein IscW_ISCW007644 [Ixodes scapularis]|uniref:Uncharacterized protein n=1 Tax=Ixodes scapularis TaxID=6945 RepID=B7PSM4_IXOSC|nr:hypothetical protein IscW_ISCW007644 [Ixodes scapularis]|eukprot:XP_002402730.1 hypothetical protein IscW_ISCW007644 [Ixodes scapularis]
MVMALDGLTRLCPSVLFDWRLYAERGCPSFFHRHRGRMRVDDCELAFLKQVTHSRGASPALLPRESRTLLSVSRAACSLPSINERIQVT